MKFSNILLAVTFASTIASASNVNLKNIMIPKLVNLDFYDSFISGKQIKKRDTNNDSYTEIIETDDFKYAFHCMEDYDNSCSVFKKELAYSLDAISSTLEIYEPIIFEVFVDDLAKYDFSGACGAVLDINYVALKASNDTTSPPYLYPQSLTKQLSLDKRPNYKQNDFIMILNNMKSMGDYYEYYLKQGYARTIIHETLHGLGHGTPTTVEDLRNIDLNKYIEDIEKDENGEINEFQAIAEMFMMYSSEEDVENIKLLPSPITNYSSDVFKNATSKKEIELSTLNWDVYGFYPLTVYDKNIVDIDTKKPIYENLSYTYEDLNNCFSNIPFKYSEYYNKTRECYDKLDTETKKVLSTLPSKYLLRDKSIGILTVDDTVVPLQTFDNLFMIGSSISHTYSKTYDIYINEILENETLREAYNNNTLITEDNVEYYLGENFLMDFQDFENLSRDVLFRTVAKNNKHGLIGPGTVSILKTLGWTEKGEQPSNDMYYLVEDIEIPEQNSFKDFILPYYELTSKFTNNQKNETQTSENITNEIEDTDNESEEVTLNVDVDDESTLTSESDSDDEEN